MSKKELHFSLHLLTNTIVSESSATSGDHQSLDYIPGATLLGVAAKRLYRDLAPEDSDLLFHSGAVRFTDALPAIQQAPGWPVPICWHQVKGESVFLPGSQNKVINSQAIFDPSRRQLEQGIQPKQLRSGYITACGHMISVAKDYELKTAINANTGAAAQAQLFGYQSIRAGQMFCFSVVADESVSDHLLKKIADCLVGEARVGRSRSAQFGHVQIEKATSPMAELEKNQSITELRLWLLSDLALLDDNGNPLLTPTAQAFGLPEQSEWLVQKSFLRTRSYAPFNAKRRCYDLQRHVISRGSVLVFKLNKPLTDEQYASLQWVGQHQAAGLGRIWVNPSLLSTESPVFNSKNAVNSVEVQPVAQPNTLLVRSLVNRRKHIGASESIEQYAKKLVNDLKSALQNAAQWAGLPKGMFPPETPNRSQWGRIRTVALAHKTDREALMTELFDSEHALLRVRKGQEAWGLFVSSSVTLADVIKQKLTADVPVDIGSQVLALACTQLMRDEHLNKAAQGGH